MNPGIRFTKVWSDIDALELVIDVCDGKSLFSNNAYVGIGWPREVVEKLRIFRNQIHGGIFDLKSGEFGPEYANGAFFARLHFHLHRPGILFVSTIQQSGYFEFKGLQVANLARMFLKTEPVLLDNFIDQLVEIERGKQQAATFQCV